MKNIRILTIALTIFALPLMAYINDYGEIKMDDIRIDLPKGRYLYQDARMCVFGLVPFGDYVLSCQINGQNKTLKVAYQAYRSIFGGSSKWRLCSGDISVAGGELVCDEYSEK